MKNKCRYCGKRAGKDHLCKRCRANRDILKEYITQIIKEVGKLKKVIEEYDYNQSLDYDEQAYESRKRNDFVCPYDEDCRHCIEFDTCPLIHR